MGYVTDEEYTTRFLELQRYVLYLTEKKAKTQGFISGLLVTFKDKIEFNEKHSLEETIQKLRRFYEQLKKRSKTKRDRKGNAKNKGKWDRKLEIPKGTSNKENLVPSKKLITSDRGQGHQYEEQNKEVGWNPIVHWTCGKDHHRKDCPQNQGGRPQIYSSQEKHIVGDVGQSVPRIHGTVDNKQVGHQASVIEMDGKICDQVIYVMIDLGSNHTYVGPDFMDKCSLSKECRWIQVQRSDFTIGQELVHLI